MGRKRKTPQSTRLVPNLYKNGKYYAYRNPLNGKRTSLGPVSERDAVLTANQLNLEFAVKRHVGTEGYVDNLSAKLKTNSKTLNELIDEYEQVLKRRIENGKLSASTFATCYKYPIRTTRKAFGTQRLYEIKTMHLTQYLATVLSSGTYRSLRTFWSLMFKYAEAQGYIGINQNPALPILPLNRTERDINKKRARLTFAAFKKILNAAKTHPKTQRVADVMTAQFYTCTDRSTILAMNLSQIENGIWYFTRQKVKKYATGSAAIRLPAAVLEIVKCRSAEAEKNHNGQIFFEYSLGENGGRIYQKDFRALVKSTGVNKDLPPGATNPTCHEIRSLGAHMMKLNGISQDNIQAAMTHADVNQTAAYQEGHEAPPVPVTQLSGISIDEMKTA